MASWINGTAATRLREYTAPQARRDIATGVFDERRDEVLADVKRAQLRHANSEHPQKDAHLENRLTRLRAMWRAIAADEAFAKKAAGQ